MLLYCITLSFSRVNQRSAQAVARRISGAVAGEIRAKSSQDLTPNNEPFLAPLPESTHKSRHTKYPSQTLTPRNIICHLPLVFLSPTSALLFYSPSLPLSLSFSSPLFRLLLICSCVGFLACHDGSR